MDVYGYLRKVFSLPNSSGWVLQALEEKILSIIRASEFFLRARYTEKAETKHVVEEFSKLLESLIPHIPVHSVLRRIHRFFNSKNLERLKSASLIHNQWRRLYQRVTRVCKIREAFKKTRILAGGGCSREDIDWKAGHRETCKDIVEERKGGHVALLYLEEDFLIFLASRELQHREGAVERLREKSSPTDVLVVDFDVATPKIQFTSPIEIEEMNLNLNPSLENVDFDADEEPLVIISRRTGISLVVCWPVS
uniref:Uncharacterized protein n=1 Tax=Moniliophthora roreri TaxID=221103 RepID=A0A0W0FWP0_MONRR